MVENHRTESALTRRPLKDREIGQRRQFSDIVGSQARVDGDMSQRSVPQSDIAQRASSQADLPDFEFDVSSSLETIHRVTQTYAVLLDKLSTYEQKVRELSQSSEAAARSRDEALRGLAKNERLLKEERARAAQAEEQADHSAAMVGELERQLAALRSQTSKLMNAVEQLFPDFEEAANGEQQGLRVVR